MGTTQIAIYNLALSHLAISQEVAALTDKSANAFACNRFYDQVRQEVLRDFPWPFSTKYTALTLVTDYTATPTRRWNYSYRTPNDLLKLRQIPNQLSRIETRNTRISHATGADDSGGLIFCDLVNATLLYTFDNTDPATFPADFAQVLALLLAAYIAPRVTGGDQFKLGDRAFKLYDWKRVTARVNALDEQQDDPAPDSDMLLYRNEGPMRNVADGSDSYGDSR